MKNQQELRMRKPTKIFNKWSALNRGSSEQFSKLKPSERFNYKLREKFLNENLSQVYIQKITKISQSSISKLMNNKIAISFDDAIRISSILDLDIYWIIDGTKKNKSGSSTSPIPEKIGISEPVTT